MKYGTPEAFNGLLDTGLRNLLPEGWNKRDAQGRPKVTIFDPTPSRPYVEVVCEGRSFCRKEEDGAQWEARG